MKQTELFDHLVAAEVNDSIINIIMQREKDY
jgi:hypothetical protein